MNKWETLFLLIMTIPIMGHVVILPILIDVVGRDSWISILLSLPAAISFAYAIYRLKLRYPTETAAELFGHLLGKWGARLVSALFIGYFSFLMILSFAALIDLVFIVFLPDTPHAAIIAWFWVFFLYAAAKGIKRIALTSVVLGFIALVAGHTITILDSGKKDWSHLLPILEFGWSPVFLGTLILISIWVELLLLLCLPMKNMKKKRIFFFWVAGILFNALMMFSTATGVITIFGLSQAENFIYPATEIVRIVSLGFIDRFDVYAMILMSFGVYVRCSLFFRIAFDISIANITAKWGKRLIFVLFALLAFFGAHFLSKEHIRIEYGVIAYTYLIFLYPIPFVLLAISQMKQRKTKQKNGAALSR